MRRTVFALLPIALVAIGMTGPGEEPTLDVRVVNIVAACTPGDNPSVQPQLIRMNRIDNISWRLASGQATGYTITPKNPQNWPFAQVSISGTPEAPPTSPNPRPEAQNGVVYSYNVTISCPDGSTQLIDPDIVIGGAQ